MPDLSVVENILYRDRLAEDVDDDDLSSLHFTHQSSSDIMLPSVNSDRYTDGNMIEDGQNEIDGDSEHIQSLYEHIIGDPHNSDASPGAATTIENGLYVCDQTGEVDTINAVDADKHYVAGKCNSSDIGCSLDGDEDDTSIGGGNVTVASLFGPDDHAVPLE